MKQSPTSLVLVLSLTLSLAACSSATTPSVTSTAVDQMALESTLSEQTPSDGPLGEDPSVNAAAAPELTVTLSSLAIAKPAQVKIDGSGGCRGVNHSADYVTCISSGLKSSSSIIYIPYGPHSAEVDAVAIRDLTTYCTKYLDRCKTIVKSNLSYLVSQTKPVDSCLNARRRLTDVVLMKRIKLGFVVSAATIIAQSGSYVGYRIADYDYYLKAINTGGHGLMGILLFEWAGHWLYTNRWSDSGPAITAEMLSATYQAVRYLPTFFHIAASAQVAPLVHETCPNPYALAFEDLPV